MPSTIRAAMARPLHLLCEVSREHLDGAGARRARECIAGWDPRIPHPSRSHAQQTSAACDRHQDTRVVKLGRTLREFPALDLIKAAEYNRASRPLECTMAWCSQCPVAKSLRLLLHR